MVGTAASLCASVGVSCRRGLPPTAARDSRGIPAFPLTLQTEQRHQNFGFGFAL